MIVLFKLLLAHLIGDFLLQPDSWVRKKETKKLKSWQLYVHTMIHFALVLILIWDITFILWAALLAVFHFITDIIKLIAQNEKSKRTWFFIDQLLHITFIFLISVWSGYLTIDLSMFKSQYFLMLITFSYMLTQPVSVLIRAIISKWTPMTSSDISGSLKNAGNYIGILERLFVFAFIVTGKWEAIGFLITAKSIFRFGDLKGSSNRKLTEYVLIGTLLSFGIALITGIVFQILNN